MNRQVTIVILFTLLVLYFTGCQKAADTLNQLDPDNSVYPESTPVEVSAKPGTKLYDFCPVGTVKEDSNAHDSSVFVFRAKYNLPEGCALPLQNSVYRPQGEDFPNAVNTISEGSYFLSYRSDNPDVPEMKCVPQNSVWLKVDEFEEDKTYTQIYQRLDMASGPFKEILTLRGYPKPFPIHKVGIRKAVCE